MGINCSTALLLHLLQRQPSLRPPGEKEKSLLLLCPYLRVSSLESKHEGGSLRFATLGSPGSAFLFFTVFGKLETQVSIIEKFPPKGLPFVFVREGATLFWVLAYHFFYEVKIF